MPRKYKKPRKGSYYSGTKVRDILARQSPVEGLTEWEFAIERVTGGATLEQEAERLQLSDGALRSWVYKHEEFKHAYQEARKQGQNAIADRAYGKAMELLGDGWTDADGNLNAWSKDMVAARREGLNYVQWAISRMNSEEFGEKKEVRHSINVENLRDRLEQIASQKKEAARLEAPSGHDIIDAEFSEVREEEPEARQDHQRG